MSLEGLSSWNLRVARGLAPLALHLHSSLLPTCFTPRHSTLAAPLAADLLFPLLHHHIHMCSLRQWIERKEIHPPGFSLPSGLYSNCLLLVKKCHSIEDGRVTVSKSAIKCLYLTSRSIHLYLCQMKYFSHQSPCHNAHLELFHTKQPCPLDEVAVIHFIWLDFSLSLLCFGVEEWLEGIRGQTRMLSEQFLLSLKS